MRYDDSPASRFAWPLCLPALAVVAATLVLPAALSVAAARPASLLDDPHLDRAVVLTLAYTALSCALQIGAGVLLGLALARLFAPRTRRAPRVAALAALPWLLPGAVAALTWAFLWERFPGLRGATGWADRPALAWAAWLLSDVWRHAPLIGLLVWTATRHSDPRLRAAAALDGAAPREQLANVTLPTLAPALSLALLLIVPRALSSFDTPYVLTRGGPGDSTASAALHAQALLAQGHTAAGAAAASLLLLFSLASALPFAFTFWPRRTRAPQPRAPAPRAAARDGAGRGGAAATALLAALGVLLPLVWLAQASGISDAQVFETRHLPLPSTGANYSDAFFAHGAWEALGRSAILAFCVTIAAVAGGAAAAYSLARLRGRAWRLALAFFAAAAFVPSIAILPALLARAPGTGVAALFLPYLGLTLPMTVLLLFAFFRQLPNNLERAALLDGARPARVVLEILLPLSAPALAAVAALVFLFCWSELPLAMSLVGPAKDSTLPVALALAHPPGSPRWGAANAIAVVGMLPALVAALFLRRPLLDGIRILVASR